MPRVIFSFPESYFHFLLSIPLAFPGSPSITPSASGLMGGIFGPCGQVTRDKDSVSPMPHPQLFAAHPECLLNAHVGN